MFLYTSWLKTSLATRHLIATEFGIAKTSPTHVADNRVVSDGYKIEDVEGALNVDALQGFTDSESTDMNELFTLMVQRIENPGLFATVTPTEAIVLSPVSVLEASAPKKRAPRKTKKK